MSHLCGDVYVRLDAVETSDATKLPEPSSFPWSRAGRHLHANVLWRTPDEVLRFLGCLDTSQSSGTLSGLPRAVMRVHRVIRRACDTCDANIVGRHGGACVCGTAWYCSRQCQKRNWAVHSRTGPPNVTLAHRRREPAQA